jgi:hypothetical protein
VLHEIAGELKISQLRTILHLSLAHMRIISNLKGLGSFVETLTTDSISSGTRFFDFSLEIAKTPVEDYTAITAMMRKSHICLGSCIIAEIMRFLAVSPEKTKVVEYIIHPVPTEEISEAVIDAESLAEVPASKLVPQSTNKQQRLILDIFLDAPLVTYVLNPCAPTSDKLLLDLGTLELRSSTLPTDDLSLNFTFAAFSAYFSTKDEPRIVFIEPVQDLHANYKLTKEYESILDLAYRHHLAVHVSAYRINTIVAISFQIVEALFTPGGYLSQPPAQTANQNSPAETQPSKKIDLHKHILSAKDRGRVVFRCNINTAGMFASVRSDITFTPHVMIFGFHTLNGVVSYDASGLFSADVELAATEWFSCASISPDLTLDGQSSQMIAQGPPKFLNPSLSESFVNFKYFFAQGGVQAVYVDIGLLGLKVGPSAIVTAVKR